MSVPKIIFKNGHSYDAIKLIATGTQFIQGQNRLCVDAQLPADSFDAIRTEVESSENLDEFTVIDDSGNKFVHSNFFKNALGLSLTEITPATDIAPAVTEERTVLTMAQLTYLEVTQKQQAEKQALADQAIADVQDAITALAFGGVE